MPLPAKDMPPMRVKLLRPSERMEKGCQVFAFIYIYNYISTH